MGCDFNVEGNLQDCALQEKVIRFVHAFMNNPGLELKPEPEKQYLTRFEKMVGKTTMPSDIVSYPFNFFGLVAIPEHYYLGNGRNMQFVFDRTGGGRLVQFLQLPEHLCPQPLQEDEDFGHWDPDVPVRISKGLYQRLGEERWEYAFMLVLIRRRWWPLLQVSDDYDVFYNLEPLIEYLDCLKTLDSEDVDYWQCHNIVMEEHRKRFPAGESDISSTERYGVIGKTIYELASGKRIGKNK